MNQEPIRVVVFGTPSYAVPTLEALKIDRRFRVQLVVTQPDRPAGRGRQSHASAVKIAAERLGLPVHQPESLRDKTARRPLVEAEADLFVVAAYGLIFGRRTLAIPRLGCLNLHASLLPRYRGASPVASAILAGDTMTGVSLMVMERGLDTGPVIDMMSTPIRSTATTESLTAELGGLGARLALEAIPRYVAGELAPRSQPMQGASHCRPLARADGWLDWTQSAAALERRVRAMWSWPRAWTTASGQSLQIHEAAIVTGQGTAPPGAVVVDRGRVRVACGDGWLVLVTVQPASGRAMPGAAWVAGRRPSGDLVLGEGETAPDLPPIVTRIAPSSG